MPLSAEIIDAYHRSGLTQEALASKIGVRRPTISDWLNGKTEPRGRNLARLKDALGLLEPVPSATAVSPRNGHPTLKFGSDYIDVQVHAAHVSAGSGLARFEQEIEYSFKLHRFIMKRILDIHITSGRIGVAWVSGDCMLPDLRDGDPVFFEYTGDLRGPSGRYVLWLNDEAIVKRVQRLADGSLELRCENRACGDKDELLIPNEDGVPILERTGRPVDFKVIGPVIWPRKAVHEVMVQEVKNMLRQGYAEIREDLERLR